VFRKLYLKNFKVWGEQLWDDGVELAPVTLFLGTNSAGKTSLLQMLLLLKQTFQSPDPDLDLNLGGQPGDIADFGTFEDVIHDHDRKNLLGLGFQVDLGWRDAAAHLATAVKVPGVKIKEDQERRVDYRASFGSRLGAPEITQLALHQNLDPPSGHQASYTLTKGSLSEYAMTGGGWGDTPFNQITRREFRPDRALFFPPAAIHSLRDQGYIVQQLTLSLLQAFREIFYLGPLRDHPKRTYLWNLQKPGEIGPRGEQAVAALLASASVPRRSRTRHARDDVKLVDQVSRWLKEIQIADALRLKRQGKSRYYDVVIERDGKSASLLDVGFGVSQVLPMLVLAYFVPRGATIIAEQPEIHLHPLAQAALADLMVEVARERNVQFIVETHSEHMFRRLQYLVADEKVRPKDCRLYFVNKDPDCTARLEQLRLDEFGRIENWPKNFFGDSLGETERQMARMMKRMISQTEGRK